MPVERSVGSTSRGGGLDLLTRAFKAIQYNWNFMHIMYGPEVRDGMRYNSHIVCQKKSKNIGGGGGYMTDQSTSPSSPCLQNLSYSSHTI
jgi:hypothetical protein